MQVPLSLLLSVRADGPKKAREELKRLLRGSWLDTGISLGDENFNGSGLDARCYANEPFKGIVIVDEMKAELNLLRVFPSRGLSRHTEHGGVSASKAASG